MAAKKITSDYEHQLVTVRLFRDSEKYKDDVTVLVNGKAWKIQRGVDVQIPRFVADVLENSLKQDNETARLIEAESMNYKSISNKF